MARDGIKFRRSRSGGELKVDLFFTPYVMQALKRNTHITLSPPYNTWVTADRIKILMKGVRDGGNEIKFNRRINLLVQKGFLKSKPMPKSEKIKRYGSAWKNVNIYTLGSGGRAYLKKYNNFDNLKGYLMTKGEAAEPEVQIIEKEIQKDVIIEKRSEDSFLGEI